MSARLLALDVGAGDALIYSQGGWYLASLDRAWRPLNVGSEGAMAWGFSAWALPVDREYEDLYAAILDARKICLTASDQGISYSISQELLRELFEESRAQQASKKGWEKRFENILRGFTSRLDRLFAARGCSPDQSFDLVMDTFRAVYEAGPVDESDLAKRIFQVALEVFERRSERIDPNAGRPGARATPEKPVAEVRERLVLRELSQLELRALYFWTLPRYGAREISLLLDLPELQVEADLRNVAGRIGRRVEELKHPELTAVCLQELQRRGDLP